MQPGNTANTTAWKVDGSAVTQPISAASLPLPTSASQEHTTAASPHSARLSDGAAFYDATKTGQLPAALVGGRLDVVVGAALPAGSATIGDVTVTELPVAGALADGAANPTTTAVGTHPSVFNGTTWDRLRGDTANGADVDVTRLPALVAGSATIGSIASITTSITPGTAAANLGKAESSTHVSADVGVAMWAVANTTPSALAANGEYVPPAADTFGQMFTRPGLSATAETIACNAGTSPCTVSTVVNVLSAATTRRSAVVGNNNASGGQPLLCRYGGTATTADYHLYVPAQSSATLDSGWAGTVSCVCNSGSCTTSVGAY